MALYKEIELFINNIIQSFESSPDGNIEDCVMDLGISAVLEGYNKHGVRTVLRDILTEKGYERKYVNELMVVFDEYYNK